MTSNIYKPSLMTVTAVTAESADVKTLRLEFCDARERDTFSFRAGQFGEFSFFGEGECTLCIASPPTRRGYIECTVRKSGRVTAALTNAEPGDVIGFRGPYGSAFPVDAWQARDVLFIAGGIGLAPVRCAIWNILDLRDRYESVTIIYGARTVGDLIYRRELEQWAERSDVRLVITVDPGGETPDWRGCVGLVPSLLKELSPAGGNAAAVACGPPIMIKFTLFALHELGFTPEQVYTTLENRMKCGLGKCGRCNIGSLYVCKDGPVFTAAQLAAMHDEY
ncbi:MAG TPA: FAD/NAD(P)-binding protein [Planctomycetota bacterium]|nr:FAD/NAD(P)-binding protein [Planctomycetota bacterium]